MISVQRLYRACSYVVALLVCWSAASSGSAQDDGGAIDWEASSRVCKPSCRSGYQCRHGECLPTCSPECSDGFLCSAEGRCVQAEPRESIATWHKPSHTCEPSCRSGFTCLSGRCVSACNPVCSAGDICTENGECVSAAQASAAPIASAAPKRPAAELDSSADSLVNVHLDVASALQFGLTGAVEVGEKMSGYLQLRVMNTGLASYYLLPHTDDDDLRLGLGAALGVHWFSAARGNMRGVFGGLALEYIFIETRDTDHNFAMFRTHALVPQLDFGYRWAFGQFLLGVSAKLGLAIPLSDTAAPIGDHGCRVRSACAGELSVVLFPGLAVDLGWFIPR